MPFFLSPVGNSQNVTSNGDPNVGGKILTYLAGTTTPAATYTSQTGNVLQANPIILNALGLPASPIWLNGGISLKFVVQDAANVTLYTLDNITGVNDATTTPTEWAGSGFVPTFISATSFSVPGDQTLVFEAGRRLRTNNTAGLVYGAIVSAVFGASITTVTVTNDAGVLDSGLSVVAYGVLSALNRSLPALPAQIAPATTAGTATAYTITPTPAVTAYAANQSFFVNFHAASGANPTLQISGLATPPTLVKQVIGTGLYANIEANDFPANHRSQVVLLSATQALVLTLPPPGQMMHVRDEKASGTAGGASAVGNQIRALNTVVTNTIVGASLAANQVTLPAGNYRIIASAPGFKAEGHRLRLVNATDATVALLGLPEYSSAAPNACTTSSVVGRIVLAATKTLNLTHFIGAAQASNGLGVPVSDTFIEVYASLMIFKE